MNVSDVSALNQQFGLNGELHFTRDVSGLVNVAISNAHARGRLLLQGAHLLEWHPSHMPDPVLWGMEGLALEPGKPPHRGVPICWPWFGAHATDAGYPAHGFVRHLPWQMRSASRGENGMTVLNLRFVPDDLALRFGYPTCQLDLTIMIGHVLIYELITTNFSSQALVIGEALHTYFQVGSIHDIEIRGLEGCFYADKVQNFATYQQQGVIRFEGECDRVYTDTAHEVVIHDPYLTRNIHIRKIGSLSTVIWNPWQHKAMTMADIAEAGWPRFVCVESANALHNMVTVDVGDSHTLMVEYEAVTV